MLIKRTAGFLFVLTMFTSSAGTAHAICFGSFGFASPAARGCVLDFPGGSVSDPYVAYLLEQLDGGGRLGGGAIRSCPSNDNESEYYVLTPISKNSRVSHYRQTRIFPRKDADKVIWSYVPPKHLQSRLGIKEIGATFMCGEEFSCDRHDAKAFVETKGLSPHLFRKLQDAWSEILKSESVFDRVFESVRGDASPDRLLSLFRSYAFKKTLDGHKIGRACFLDPDDPLEKGSSQFLFQVGDVRSMLFLVGYEYSDDGIEILDIGYAIE